MKFIDNLALKIFSIIIFVVSIVFILCIANIVPVDFVTNVVSNMLSSNGFIRATLIILVVLCLLAIKAFFFPAKKEDEGKSGIVLENNNGKLVISKESLDNMIAGVARDIPGAEFVSSKTFLDKNKNLIVYVTTVVSKDIMLKDISVELQTRIKDALKRTADLNAKEVNIRIKNITSKKSKMLPEAQAQESNVLPKEEISEQEVNTSNNKNEEIDM